MLERAFLAWRQHRLRQVQQQTIATEMHLNPNTISRYIAMVDEIVGTTKAQQIEDFDEWIAECRVDSRLTYRELVKPKNLKKKDLIAATLTASTRVLITTGDLEDKHKHEVDLKDTPSNELIDRSDRVKARIRRLEGIVDRDDG